MQRYLYKTCIVNEVFLKWIQPSIAVTLFIKNNQIKIIEMEEVDEFLYPIIVDVAKKCNVKINGKLYFFKMIGIFKGHFYIILSFLYLLWKLMLIPHSNQIETENKKIAIIRTPAARKKMAFLNDVNVKLESLKDKNTVYNCFSKKQRIWWVLKAWKSSYREIREYQTVLNESLGSYSALDAFVYYSKRVVHTFLYSYMITKYFSRNKGATYYTGNNLDRFAVIEENISKKYNIKTVCIPHGLEYGFKLPLGFTCNEFYTTSMQAAKHLNLLYNTNKFIFNKVIAKKMFAVSFKAKKQKRIVFFTEPREVNVNIKIIDELLPLLEKEKIVLNLKLHPKDQKKNYLKYKNRICILEDFNEAITNNICFSRKSTTILEALYNNSKAAAILINQKDRFTFNTFPSLQENEINVYNNITGLFEWVKKHINESSG